MSSRRIGQEVGDLSWRMRLGDVPDAQAVANHATGMSVSPHALARLVAAVNSGCGWPSTPAT